MYLGVLAIIRSNKWIRLIISKIFLSSSNILLIVKLIKTYYFTQMWCPHSIPELRRLNPVKNRKLIRCFYTRKVVRWVDLKRKNSKCKIPKRKITLSNNEPSTQNPVLNQKHHLFSHQPQMNKAKIAIIMLVGYFLIVMAIFKVK